MKKKFIAVLLAVVTGCCGFALASCRNRIDPNDPQKLEIYLYNAGYGYQWCIDILDAFKEEPWVKEKYPQLKTSFSKDELQTHARELLGAPKKVNKYDIIMGTGMENALTPDSGAVELAEPVYNSEVPGEGVLFKDKLIKSYLAAAAYNSPGMASGEKRYYQVNWASGMTGVIYNEDMLTALGFGVPNTTAEFIKIMQDVKALNGSHPAYPANKNQSAADLKTSFATYGSSAYALYLYYTWWAQYQTAAEYVNFYNGVDSGTNSRSPAIFNQTGILKSLQTMESFMHRDNGVMWLNPDTGREAYRTTQNRVLLGNSLFMANGDWVDNELAELREGLLQQPNGRADTVKMMRTPIISSIIEKTPTITDDAALSKVVKAIDNGETGCAGVSAEDFTIISEARKVVYSIGPGHNAVIPDYASGKEPAIDFLRYLATDKANEIYIRSTNGASLPFEYDLKAKNPVLFGQISPMQKGRLDYFSAMNIGVLPPHNSFPLVRYGGLSCMSSGSPLSEFTSAAGPYGTLAQAAFDRERTYWTENGNSRWNNALARAGM